MSKHKSKYQKAVALMAIGAISATAVAQIPASANVLEKTPTSEEATPKAVAVAQSPVETHKKLEIGDSIKLGIYDWTVIGWDAKGNAVLITNDATSLVKPYSPYDTMEEMNKQLTTVFPDAGMRDKLVDYSQRMTNTKISKSVTSKFGFIDTSEYNKYKANIPLATSTWSLNGMLLNYEGMYNDVQVRYSPYVKTDGTVVPAKVTPEQKEPTAALKLRPITHIKADYAYITPEGTLVDHSTKAPTAVTATVDTKNQVTVEWDEGVDVTGYTLMRNGNIIYQGKDRSFVDTVYSGSDYTYDIYSNYHDMYTKWGKATTTATTEAFPNKDNVTPMAVDDVVYHANKEYTITSITANGEAVGKATVGGSSVTIKAEESFKYEDGKGTIVPLNPATNVKAVKSGSDARVTWTQDSNAIGYEIDRNGWTKPLVLGKTYKTFDDSALNAAFDYDYTVTALYPGGLKGPAVNVSTADITPPVDPPTDGGGNGGGGDITINNNWNFGDTTIIYMGGKPTVTVFGGKSVGDVFLDGFMWVTEETIVPTANGDITLKPGKGGTVLSVPDGLGNGTTSTTMKVEHAGQHFITIVIKPVPKLDFGFGF